MKRALVLVITLLLAGCAPGSLLRPIREFPRRDPYTRTGSTMPNRASLLYTQWGTWRLGGVSATWWTCTDRYERCSDGPLQMIQMDNTLAAVRRDLCRAEGAYPPISERRLGPLRVAVRRADEARARVPRGPLSREPYWSDPLADYTQATIDAERAANKLLPQVYGYWSYEGWKPTAAQAACR